MGAVPGAVQFMKEVVVAPPPISKTKNPGKFSNLQFEKVTLYTTEVLSFEFNIIDPQIPAAAVTYLKLIPSKCICTLSPVETWDVRNQ